MWRMSPRLRGLAKRFLVANWVIGQRFKSKYAHSPGMFERRVRGSQRHLVIEACPNLMNLAGERGDFTLQFGNPPYGMDDGRVIS